MAFCVDTSGDVIAISREYSRIAKLGNRGDGSDGTQSQQLIGIIGENLIRNMIGLPYMIPIKSHDKGVDVTIYGLKFDVKTMGRDVTPKVDYVNNLMASQIKFDVDGYIFVSINKSDGLRATICGWSTKQNFIEKAKLHKIGSIRTRTDGSTFKLKADTYEICNADINHSAKSEMEFLAQIYELSKEKNVTTPRK